MIYNQPKRIDYEIQFKANQQSLRTVASTFEKMLNSKTIFKDLQIINNSTKEKAREDFLEIQDVANKVSESITAAFNPKLGITNIDAFKANLRDANLSIESVRDTFNKAGKSGEAAFQAMANSMTNVRLTARESATIFDKMADGLKRSLGWTTASSIINRISGSIQEAYGYVKHLDTSLNDIRIVTEYSADAMDRFAEKANKAAISLGKSTTDYTEAALIYYQQGLGEEDVSARTNVTLKTANVTQQSTAQVSEELTAIWNGYKVNAEEAELYIDKVAKVAATTAADLEEMATGMSKVASAANVMGVDIDQMNAILATTISVTRQAPESVGAAYKTIFARMSQIEAGEETEDGATLKSYTEQMAAMGVSVLDTNGKLRDMGDIIEEVGEKWSDWGREQQIAFSQIAAGTRQYNNLIALFDNWDMYKQSLEDSRNAMGTLQAQQDIYMESTAAHLQQLRTAAEGVYDSLLSSKDVNSVVDGLTKIVKGTEPVVEGIGGLKNVLSSLAPILIGIFSKDIGNVAGQFFNNLNVSKENVEKLRQLELTLQGLKDTAPEVTQRYIDMTSSLKDMAKYMSPEQYNHLANQIQKQAQAQADLATQVEKTAQAERIARQAQTKEDVAGHLVESTNKKLEKTKQNIEALELEKQKIQDETQILEEQIAIQGDLKQIKQDEITGIDEEIKKINDAQKAVLDYQDYAKSEKQIQEDQLKLEEEQLKKLEEQKKAAQEYLNIRKQITDTVHSGGTAPMDIVQQAEKAKDILINASNGMALGGGLRNANSQKAADQEAESVLYSIDNYILEVNERIADKKKEIANTNKEIQTAENEAVQLLNDAVNLEDKKKDVQQQILDIEKEINDLKNKKTNSLDEEQKKQEEIAQATQKKADLEDKLTEYKKKQAEATADNTKKQLDLNAATADETRLRAEAQKTLATNSELISQSINVLFQGLTKGAATLTGVISAFKAGKNFIEILTDDKLTAIEKFTKGIAALATTVTTGGFAINSFLNTVKSIKSAVNAATVSITLNKIATEEMSAAEIKQTIVKSGQTVATHASTAAIYAETKAALINKAVMYGLEAAIIAISAALIAYAIYCASGAKAEHDLAKASEEATEAYKKEKETLQELQEKQNNLNNLVDTYKEQKKALDDLVAGTEEWNNQMESLSETVDKLIKDYPELITYATYNPNTHSYSIDENELEKFQKEQTKKTINQQVTTDRAAYIEAQTKIKELEFKEQKYGGFLDELNEWQDKEIAIRKKLVNELNEQAHSEKEYNNYEEYLLDSVNTMRREGLKEGQSKEDYIKSQLVWAMTRQQYYDENGQLRKGVDITKFNKSYNYNRVNTVLNEDGTVSYQDSNYGWQRGTLEEFVKKYNADISAYSEVTSLGADEIKEAIDNGITSLEELPLNLLKTLKGTYVNGQQVTDETIKQIQEQRKNKYFTNNQERETYDALISENGIKGIGDASPEELDQLAQKIAETYRDSGLEGVQQLEERLKGKPLKIALDFTVEDKPLEKYEQILAQAEISKEDFELAKKQAQKNETYNSDESLARLMAAEEDLNHVYQNRAKIFKDLEHYDAQKKTHRDEMDSVQKALSGWFGKDVDESFIQKKAKEISKIFNDTLDKEVRENAKKTILEALNKQAKEEFNQAKQDLSNLFIEYQDQFNQGEVINDSEFLNQIQELAEKLDLEDEQLKDIMRANGFIWDEEKQKYIKLILVDPIPEQRLDESNYQAQWWSDSSLREAFSSFDAWMLSQGFEKRDDGWYKSGYIYINPYIQAIGDKAQTARNIAKGMSAAGYNNHDIAEAVRNSLGPGFETVSDDEIWRFLNSTEVTIDMLVGINYQEIQADELDLPTEFTAATIEETYTPVLDLSAEERQIDDLTNSINRLKDAQKDLNGEALVSNIDQQIELEGQLYEAKVAKINKEKEYQAELRSSFSQEKTRIKNAMADDEKTSGLESQYKEYSFTYDSEGYIKNANEVDKQIQNDIQTLTTLMKSESDGEKKSIYQAQIDDLTALQTSYSNFASSYNSSLENTTKLTEEEYEYLKQIRSLEEDRAKAAADRTNATKAQLTALDKESASLSKALEALGDAGDYSGQTLINYNESYSKLLDEQTKNAEAHQKVLAEEQSRLKEGSQGYLSDIGINLDDYKLEDGTYDIDAMAAKVDEMTAANKDNVQEVENINHAWKMAKYGVENLNKDIEEQEKLCDEVLKITKEQARVKWSTDFAQVNKELSDIETKLGRADKQLTRSKSLYDKQTTEGKIDMMSSYYGDIDAVDEYYDKLDSRLVEKAKTLGDKLQEDGVNMPSILKDYFSLDDPDEIFGNYNTFMENLEDTKDKILEETQKARDSLTLLEKENKMYTTDENGKQVLTEEAETLTKKIEDLGSAYEMLGTFAEEADRKEERALNKQPDMSAVQALSKEWKSAAVDREIKKVNRELTLLQKQQSRLKGKDVITNLQQQVAVIQKHIKLEQKKLELMKSELKLQKTLIQGSIKRLQLESLGSAFDADGHVSATFLDALSKKSDIANDKLQDLISSLKEYESMMSEIESQEDVIVGLQDNISDKNYEIAQKIKEETRKAAEKALNQFKINLEIALDAAEAFRKIDRLQAKIDRLRETDWFNQSVLDYNDAISYATNDVTLLTDAVNKLIGDYNSGAWKDMYDTQKDARDDIMSYANQLMDAVQSYYDAIDSAKEKYASAIDSIISANQDLINDFERIKKYANQGINLTKLLPGGGNDKDIEHYYDQIDKVNKKEIDYLLQQKDYYKALLSTLDPLNQPDLFKSVKSAYDSIMEEIDAKTAESIQNYTEGLKESIERAARAAKQQIAELSGYASPELQQIAHDRQDQILKDYYDVYESEYEIASLANKYTKAISETDNLAHKKELTKVMQEQLKLLKEQAGEEKRLTKYEVDRANAVYELTLRQMALDEAKANKSQMRLRRDTQGNYRYEYVSDEAQTTDATQAVLDAQYKIYELDKNRLVELTKAKEKLLDDYTTRLNEILDNQYMNTEQKEAAVEELRAWYLEQSQQLYENYAEAVTNINESSAGNLDDTLQEMIDEVGETADEAKEHFGTIDEKIVELADDMDEKLRELEQRISEAMEKIGGSIESVQDPIDAQIDATQELIDVDKELIDEWENQVSAMQNMLDMLASLESQYRALMEAALAAADAAARLQVTDFSTADERDSETTSETNKTSTTTGGGSGSGSGSGSSDDGKHGKVWADWDGDTNTMYVDGASLDEKARATISKKIHEDFPWADIYWRGRKKGVGTAVQYSYDTGGYTGEWGTDGRIAILHQKELVLNAKDTENFLQATQILRTLQNNINQIQANVNNGFSPNVNVSAPAADLNQNVHIEANFPNVSNSREIKEAFNNLVNMASQRAMSTRR